MLKRYFLKISYLGRDYHGWQIQPSSTSIQEELTNCIRRIVQHEIKIVGCGRTDTGVHASCFYAHVDLATELTCKQLVYKLNKVLPEAIAVEDVFLVHNDAHARFDASLRSYNYFIHKVKNPFINHTSWYYPHDLAIDKMNEACKLLVGEQDFTSFSKLHTDVKTNFCDVKLAEWEVCSEHSIRFTIVANRFLRNMVRAIVGTLIDVGRGKLSLRDFEGVIKRKDRGAAGVSVPGHGLFLSDVQYPYIIDGVYNAELAKHDE